ncbi:MAG: (d)CMP kinase [Alphaproteobacteria bacterium]|nr:(d)CMP kinase [Alphaproteobacteria bacterium]
MSMRGVIAIDGVSSSGKGKLASELASHYGCEYLPTGNLYRIVAKTCLDKNIDTSCDDKLLDVASHINRKDFYREDLQEDRISEMASKISKNQALRDVLNKFQINWIKEKEFCVVEGRDIGTKICPEADVKFYLSADAKVRAKRRCEDLIESGKKADESSVYQSLIERDDRDKNRPNAPLRQAKDAYFIDTTDISIEEMVSKAINIVEKKLTIR